MSLLSTIIERGKLWLWRRSQHDNAKLRAHFRDRYRINVGMYSYGCFDRWRMPGPIEIGRYCSIASSVRSVPINHPYDAMTTHPALYERKFGAVDEDIHWDDVLVIEDDVWIGHNVMILPGCKFIGRGAIIGAGAIVTKNVDRYAIMAGNPARKLRDRFDPVLAEALDASRWWEMDIATLRQLIATQRDLVFHPAPDAVARRIEAWRTGSQGGQP
ncbi:CatB-related O-acetyltransferase [Sphingobium sp. B2]|uniref:CatB-related O-acetyltransferase n=1 Tax=Sphingobium sp. B2 TaxID=2583228 RepID=UPI0011AA6FB5|nr:CatB-related O-acetyltransferase [Sphingobium sp. B2]